MKVLVTGANGFIGQALLTHLESAGYEIVPAVRCTRTTQELSIGDIGSKPNWQTALNGIDTVIHLAARVHMMRDTTLEPLTEFRKVNVQGTLHLARQAAEAGVRRFVFLSSIKVNGEASSPDKPFQANDPPKPEDNYAISKREAEDSLLSLAQKTGMEIVIIRSPLVYGPGVKGNFASMINWIQKSLPLPLGAVHNKRSLVALDNLVSFIALCADREKSPQAANEIFLISDGEDISTTGLLRKVARAYGKKSRLIPVPANWMRFGAKLLGKADMADRLLGDLVVDSSKARQLLGWQPVVTMDQQLQKVARDVARL